LPSVHNKHPVSGYLKIFKGAARQTTSFFGNASPLYPTELPAESWVGLELATNVVSKAFVFLCREKRWAASLAGFRRFRRAGIEPTVSKQCNPADIRP